MNRQRGEGLGVRGKGIKLAHISSPWQPFALSLLALCPLGGLDDRTHF